MSKEKHGSIVKKLVVALMTLALTLMCLPMSAQTVKAEGQVKVEISYLYVNAAGGNSLYTDIKYVPEGTSWGDFFAGYAPLHQNNGLADNNPANDTWELSVQNRTYDPDSYDAQVTVVNFNRYSDCAYVQFYGYPQATYKHAFMAFEYIENGECVDSGTGWDFLIPKAYACGSNEAIDYANGAKSIYSYIEQYCSKPGATVTWEARSGGDIGWDGYILSISANTTTATTTTTPVYDPLPLETSYTTDSGEALRRVAAEGNDPIALDGTQELIPSGAKFTSAKLTEGDTYNRAATLVAQKINRNANFRVYEMNLADSSNVAIHQLNGYVNVTLPIPEGLSASNGKYLMVYRVEDDGTLTRCDTATANGYLTFATNHFSTYVIVEETGATSPKTGEGSVAFILMIAAMAAVVCGTYFGKKKAICK